MIVQVYTPADAIHDAFVLLLGPIFSSTAIFDTRSSSVNLYKRGIGSMYGMYFDNTLSKLQ